MVAKRDYYDYGPVLSYNAAYNMIAGARGLGKTWGAIDRAIRDWERKKEEFFYLRRYKDEIKKSAPVFFDAHAFKYPHLDFRTASGRAEVASAETRGQKGREWTTIGHFGALSVGQQFKGATFPNVTKIIYDECILERGNAIYLKDEVIAFNNFYNTVDRYTGRTKAFLLANAVEMTNPFFLDWGIRPDEGREFNVFDRDEDGTVFGICHLPQADLYQSQVSNTRYGRFIRRTSPEYADYAIGNKFSDAHQERITEKTSAAKYRLTLETRSQTVSVWYDHATQLFYITAKRPKNEKVFTIDRLKMGPGKVYLEYGSKILSSLRTAWNHDRMMFDSPNTRNLFIDVFKR